MAPAAPRGDRPAAADREVCPDPLRRTPRRRVLRRRDEGRCIPRADPLGGLRLPPRAAVADARARCEQRAAAQVPRLAQECDHCAPPGGVCFGGDEGDAGPELRADGRSAAQSGLLLQLRGAGALVLIGRLAALEGLQGRQGLWQPGVERREGRRLRGLRERQGLRGVAGRAAEAASAVPASRHPRRLRRLPHRRQPPGGAATHRGHRRRPEAAGLG
mmetsp:Transcript_74726/g.218925  ORF Transcript_74726/g.218925 Transcript_74726/m.218925 type:complete len:217 (-) Transcript_74726:171-821(-)